VLNHKLEFSKYALNYSKNSLIQKEIAGELISSLDSQPKKILDLGCGTGHILNNINWEIEKFIGVDFSQNMCDLHKKDKNIEIICDNFDNPNLYKQLEKYDFDMILSSSSLQWSKNFNLIVDFLLKNRFSIALFTANTFKTINQMVNQKSPILSKETIVNKFQKYKNIEISIKNYKIEFNNNFEMLQYIKRSGIGGNQKQLDYKSIKQLINNYPLNYLEFEVLFIKNY